MSPAFRRPRSQGPTDTTTPPRGRSRPPRLRSRPWRDPRLTGGIALIGAAVMPAADWLGRQIMFPYEVPAGMTATLLGGAYFMFMMRRM